MMGSEWAESRAHIVDAIVEFCYSYLCNVNVVVGGTPSGL
jgi:hypothetical protein